MRRKTDMDKVRTEILQHMEAALRYADDADKEGSILRLEYMNGRWEGLRMAYELLKDAK